MEAERASVEHPARAEDPTVRYLRHRDILDSYNGQDPLMHHTLLAEAVREKDIDFIEALASAPRYRRKFDPALVMAAREQLAEMANPTIAKLAAQMAAYDRLYQTAATVVRETAAQVGIARLVTEPTT
jgi:hypothetical protein